MMHPCTYVVQPCIFGSGRLGTKVFDMPRPNASVLAGLAALSAACSDDATPRGPAADRIELPGPMFYPEGVTFDDAGTMYVSSILTGALARVPSGGSAAEELVPAGVLGTGLVGITMSQRDDLVWLCLGTFGTDNPPAVIGIRKDGTEVVRHAFPPQADGRTGGLCNEITEDAAGNIYASDSFGARILTVPAATRTVASTAQVFASGPALGATMFGVNGIVFDGDDAILAVNTESGGLFRIPIATAAIEPVTLARPLAGPDGLRLVSPGRLVTVEQGAGRVAEIALDTGAITPLRDGLRTPTSLDVIDGQAWVAEGQLSHLFDMTAPELPFYAYRVEL